MFTPTEQTVPGQTPAIDPLQMQFLTGGQMGYMPQAQFLTPSMYGSFRTLPSADVNTMPNDGGLWHSLMVRSTAENPNGFFSHITRPYNPVVSGVQQQVYASRRWNDTWDTASASMNNVGLQAALGALAFVPGMTIPSLALAMLAPDIAKPVTDRLRTTREIQDMTTHKIFSGPDVDTELGYGFSNRAARDIDRFIRREAADDTVLDKGDYQELLKLGIQYNQFDNATSADQYKRTLKKMRGVLDTIMQVMGSSDLEEVVKNMNRMRDMGATMDRYQSIAREEKSHARMIGMSHQEAVETYGKPGAVLYQQAGLNPMQGSLEAMANAANMTYLKRTGILDPLTEAKFGGISGIVQEMTAQSADANNQVQNLVLPGLMNADMTGLKEGIDLKKIARDRKELQRLIDISPSLLNTQEKTIKYEQHKDVAFAQLGKDREGLEDLNIGIAGIIGQQLGYSGYSAIDAGLIRLGYSPEIAAKKREAYYSPEAREARWRAIEESKYNERKKDAQQNSFWGQFGRAFSRWATDFGESLFDYSTKNKFNRDGGDLTEKQKADMGKATTPLQQGDVDAPKAPVAPPSGGDTGPVIPNAVPDKTEQELTALHLKEGLLTAEEAKTYVASASKGLFHAETGKTDPMEAMRTVHAHAMGGYQITLEELATGFFEKDYLKPYEEKYFKGLDKKVLMSAWNKVEKKHGLATKLLAKGDAESLEKLKKETGLTDEEIKQIYLVQNGWKTAIEDKDFFAGAVSFSKDNLVIDRMRKTTMISQENKALIKEAASGSLTFMNAVESVGNLFGTAGYSHVVNNFLKGKTADSIKASIDKDGGLSLALEFLERAKDESAYQAKDGKPDSRFVPGTDRYEGTFLEREHRGRRAAPSADHPGEAPAMGSFFSDTAIEMWNNSAFAGTSDAKPHATGVEGVNNARHDCSGFVSAVFRRDQKLLEGQAELADPVRRAMAGEGATADDQRRAFAQVAGGKKRTVRLDEGDKKKGIEDLKSTLKVGDVIYLKARNDFTTSSGRKYAKGEAYHTGIVVQGPNGEKMIAEDNGSGVINGKKVSNHRFLRTIDQAVKEGISFSRTGEIEIYNTNDAFVYKDGVPSNIPGEAKTENPEELERRQVEAAEKAAKRAMQRNAGRVGVAQDHPDFGEYGDDWLAALLHKTMEGIGVNKKDSVPVSEDTVNTWLYAEKLAKSRSATFLGKDLRILLGQNADITPEILSNALEIGGDDAPIRNLLSNFGRFSDDKFSDKEARSQWRAVVKNILAKVHGTSPESFSDDVADKILNNKEAMGTLRAMILQIYKHVDPNDPEANTKRSKDASQLYTEAEQSINAYKAGPVSRTNELDNATIINNFLAAPLGIKYDSNAFDAKTGRSLFRAESERFGGHIYTDGKEGVSDERSEKAFRKARDAYEKVAKRKNIVGKKKRTEATYYEQTSTIMNLYNEYKKADSRGYSKEQKTKLKEKLEELGNALGVDSSEIRKLIEGGASNFAFTKKVLELATGQTIDQEKNGDVVNLLQGLSELFLNEKKGANIDDLLKTNFKDILEYNTSEAVRRESQYTDAISRYFEYTGGSDPKDFADKSKVSDVRATQILELLRSNGFKTTADKLEKSRSEGKPIDFREVAISIGKDAGIAQTNPGAPDRPYTPGDPAGGKMPAPVAPPGGLPGAPGTQGTPGTQGAPGAPGASGGAGAIFKPETETAFQQLPNALQELKEIMKKVYDKLDK